MTPLVANGWPETRSRRRQRRRNRRAGSDGPIRPQLLHRLCLLSQMQWWARREQQPQRLPFRSLLGRRGFRALEIYAQMPLCKPRLTTRRRLWFRGTSSSLIRPRSELQGGYFRSSAYPREAHSSVHHPPPASRSEEHTSELQSLMRISYAVFCL